jgi:hypothetical protein
MNEDYKNGWHDAFDAIADYVEKEVCIITASMIRRMKHESWRVKEELSSTASDGSNLSDGHSFEGSADSLEHK